MSNKYKHIPVLLKESIDFLNLKQDGTYVDCTLGGGGHSEPAIGIALRGVSHRASVRDHGRGGGGSAGGSGERSGTDLPLGGPRLFPPAH